MKSRRIAGLALIGAILGFFILGAMNGDSIETSKLMAQAAGREEENQATEESERKKLEKIIEESIVPITFHGKVVDEKGNPVDGATVILSVTDQSEDGTTPYRVKSGKGGLFSLTGVKGGGISVRFFKEGYYTPRKGGSYFYSHGPEKHIPDLKNPVIFILRKMGEVVDLVRKHEVVDLPRDGTPVRFNFLKGKVSSDGELEVRAWKPPREETRRRKLYDWKVVISIPGGGFKEYDANVDEFPFLAPEEGYAQTIEINMPASLGDKWKQSVEKHFYFEFGNPKKYARGRFSTGGGGFAIECYTNPGGSRNLAPKTDEEGLW